MISNIISHGRYRADRVVNLAKVLSCYDAQFIDILRLALVAEHHSCTASSHEKFIESPFFPSSFT